MSNYRNDPSTTDYFNNLFGGLTSQLTMVNTHLQNLYQLLEHTTNVLEKMNMNLHTQLANQNLMRNDLAEIKDGVDEMR